MHTPHLTHDHGHNHDTAHILTHLPGPEAAAEASAVFALLGDSSRIRIFWLLCHTEECVCNIAAAVGVDVSRINVKATTEEKLGFTGSMEGMSCHAVCLLEE